MELLRQVVGLEYQALALVAAPLTSGAACWGLRQVMAHLRDQRASAYATRLVAWAEQAIPDKSVRYHEVAALLSRRFPMLSGEQVEVLIESEVLGLKAALRRQEAGAIMPGGPAAHGDVPPVVVATTAPQSAGAADSVAAGLAVAQSASGTSPVSTAAAPEPVAAPASMPAGLRM